MRRVCPKCGSTSVLTFDADEDWCTQCKSRFPGLSNMAACEACGPLYAEITALRSQLSIVEGARDTLYNLVGVEMGLKEKAESERDTWQSAHDAIYAELQGAKEDVTMAEAARDAIQGDWREGCKRIAALESELAEATRLQKKAEMLLESSERCRATIGKELLQMTGERDRHRKALKIYADENEWSHSTRDDHWRLLFNSTERDAHGWETARAALHPATPTPPELTPRPSQRKGLLIEACFIKDCPPFIYGVNGHATSGAIEEMEEQLQEDAADIEDGTYLYECYHESAEYGFEGRMEHAAYWQMDQIGYWPLEEDALHPATEAPDVQQ